jgi:3-keto-disaccharide hydrolase/GMC oxidoreductase
MAISDPQTTDFTRDVLGRFICNGLEEALASTDRNARRRDGSPQSDARPFDVIVIGGGSFGVAMAQHLHYADKTHSHRILVLDAGSLVLTEHVQNLPVLGLGVPGPTETDPFVPREQVWGLPWRSDVRGGFPGLAYSLGGRSVYFGGWSPRLLEEEMPDALWPAAVKSDLQDRYFDAAAEQIGTDSANDFIKGPLHLALRQQLFTAIQAGEVTEAVPLDQLPLHLADVDPGEEEISRLEAPLAVQSNTVSGLFPVNKFSSIPLLITAARTAAFDAQKGMPFVDDVKKRFMVVPHCRVIRLATAVQGGQGRVTAIETEVYQPVGGDGANVRKQRVNVPVGEDAKVVIALGTIESARLALLSFQGIANYDRIGRNLMAHLRSNLTIRIPRESLSGLDPALKDLQASALFVKGRHVHADGTKGSFHQQITASGLDRPSTDSEAELFKKIPDVDTFEAQRRVNDTQVVITIRGIGEMQPGSPDSRITLSTETDEVGVQRAFVHLVPGAKDKALWDAMDRMADEIAAVFSGGNPFEVLDVQGNWIVVQPGDDLSQVLPYKGRADGGRRDGLGTTHHEAGTLAMGADPATSVTDANGRFHFVANAYAMGPALFPTVGSPNPMLTGVALARRLADQLAVPTFTADPGFELLFDGASTDLWRMSKIRNQPGRDNPGTFLVVDRSLESLPGTDLGLFWCIKPTPQDFILKLEWRRWRDDDNSGVFVRFPDPNSKGYDNTAYVAINFGFEVQIDQLARDDGAPVHLTSAIYGLAGPADPAHLPVKAPGEWNQYEIRVKGQTYTVLLNGVQVTTYTNPDPNRGTGSFIGLQAHTGRVAFRKIQIKELV